MRLDVLPHVREADERRSLLSAILDAIRGIPYGRRGSGERLRSDSLLELAPYFKGPLLSEAFEIAGRIEQPRWRARAQAALAGRLPEPEREEPTRRALATARALDDPEARVDVLAAAITGAAEPLRMEIVNEALLALPSVKDEVSRAVLFDQLATGFSDAVLERALEGARSMGELRHRANALTTLASRIGGDRRESVLSEAMEVASKIDDLRYRSRVVDEMAALLSEAQLRALLTEVRTFGDVAYRAQAVSAVAAALASQVAGPERDALVREAVQASLDRPGPGGRGGGSFALDGVQTPGEAARQLLEAMPTAEREAVLREWLGGESAQAEARTVNTGFAAASPAADEVARDMPLSPRQRYFFWLDVGPPSPHSIEATPTPLPVGSLPARALLRVSIHAEGSALHIAADESVGELQLEGASDVRVLRQPAESAPPPADSGLRRTRLYFPITTGAAEGPARLFCDIHCQGTLVQWSSIARASALARPCGSASATWTSTRASCSSGPARAVRDGYRFIGLSRASCDATSRPAGGSVARSPAIAFSSARAAGTCPPIAPPIRCAPFSGQQDSNRLRAVSARAPTTCATLSPFIVWSTGTEPTLISTPGSPGSPPTWGTMTSSGRRRT
jgi:hypothetical protein